MVKTSLKNKQKLWHILLYIGVRSTNLEEYGNVVNCWSEHTNQSSLILGTIHPDTHSNWKLIVYKDTQLTVRCSLIIKMFEQHSAKK